MAFITGTENADTLTGTGEIFDQISGLGGNDSAIGGLGSDNLYGGDGNDTLRGGFQNDYLAGDAELKKHLPAVEAYRAQYGI